MQQLRCTKKWTVMPKPRCGPRPRLNLPGSLSKPIKEAINSNLSSCIPARHSCLWQPGHSGAGSQQRSRSLLMSPVRKSAFEGVHRWRCTHGPCQTWEPKESLQRERSLERDPLRFNFGSEEYGLRQAEVPKRKSCGKKGCPRSSLRTGMKLSQPVANRSGVEAATPN